jgi:hypothetical protein
MFGLRHVLELLISILKLSLRLSYNLSKLLTNDGRDVFKVRGAINN